MSLTGKVAIVTGASRGVGKGIALQLGEAGATVYITGRTVQSQDGAPTPGSLNETAKEVEARGGKCIPVACDHSVESDVEALFARVAKEQNGQLDMLVNNAYSAASAIMEARDKPFWTLPVTFWDLVNNVGLRNNYICSVLAAKLMTNRESGLIINISSSGGRTYLFNVAYGVGKAACDRMAADCSVELKQYNVTYISLSPGPVRTELVDKYMLKPREVRLSGQFDSTENTVIPSAAALAARRKSEAVEDTFAKGESTEFCGKCIVALASDPNVQEKTGRVLTTRGIGQEYVLKDVDGRSTSDFPQPKSAL